MCCLHSHREDFSPLDNQVCPQPSAYESLTSHTTQNPEAEAHMGREPQGSCQISYFPFSGRQPES